MTLPTGTLKLGFTGTQKGMRHQQEKAVAKLLWNAGELHLGDCVGADQQAHRMAEFLGIKLVGHPPSDNRKRAFLKYDEERKPRAYLLRDLDIAFEGVDGLIAAPRGYVEELRSGTWTTVRYARKLGRRIWIVRPDGSVVEEK